MKEKGLDERTRAEDILLGSLGYGEGARIISVARDKVGYHGVARWDDGEEFTFSSDEENDQLQDWALTILGKLQARASRAA